MNNLTEMLQRLAEPDDVWTLQPETLLREGKRRLRRRRLAVGAGAVAAALVAAVIITMGALRGNDRAEVVHEPKAPETSQFGSGHDFTRNVRLTPTCGYPDHTCRASGTLPGRPDNHRIEIFWNGTKVATTWTDHGRFSYKFRPPRSHHKPLGGSEAPNVSAREYDAEGALVWSGGLPSPTNRPAPSRFP